MDRRHVRAALIAVVLHNIARVSLVVLDILHVAVRGVVDLRREYVVEVLRKPLLHLRLELPARHPCRGTIGSAGPRCQGGGELVAGGGVDVVGEDVAGRRGGGR